jgi:hypothetical protein
MATVKTNTPQQQAASKTKQAAQPAKRAASKSAPTQTFLFDRDNYVWMGAGVVLILLGMALMVGGKSANPHDFKYDEIYSFRRITLAPIVMLIGFVLEVYAIMKKPKENQNKTV